MSNGNGGKRRHFLNDARGKCHIYEWRYCDLAESRSAEPKPNIYSYVCLYTNVLIYPEKYHFELLCSYVLLSCIR